MSLFHCKKCNALFEKPNEKYVGSNVIAFFCPECNSRDLGRVAS
jgi:hypothetical protein